MRAWRRGRPGRSGCRARLNAAASAVAGVLQVPTVRAGRDLVAQAAGSAGSVPPRRRPRLVARLPGAPIGSAAGARRRRRGSGGYCSCRSRCWPYRSKAPAGSPSSRPHGISPPRAARSPPPWPVAAISRDQTGASVAPRSPVSSASRAAPAAGGDDRRSTVFRTPSGGVEPEPVDRTAGVPTGWPRATIRAPDCGPFAVTEGGRPR